MNDLDIFSQPRLARYRLTERETSSAILTRYLWNIQLSEAFYPALSIFEVAFRNRVDQAISSQYGLEWLHEDWPLWPQNIFYPRKEIRTKKAKLKSNAERGHLVAELTLGFWVTLFKKPFKPLIWDRPGLFEKAFPAFTSKALNRPNVVFEHLEGIRIIRNRISHHEPIFDFPKGLDQGYEALEQMIFWLSPEAGELLRSISRFEEVWKQRR